MKHTPTPWYFVFGAYHDGLDIWEARTLPNLEGVNLYGSKEIPITKENCEFATVAVNHHEELVEALKESNNQIIYLRTLLNPDMRDISNNTTEIVLNKIETITKDLYGN